MNDTTAEEYLKSGIAAEDLDRLQEGNQRTIRFNEILHDLETAGFTPSSEVKVLSESAKFAFEKRPSTIMFIGPSGVGKTKISQLLIGGDPNSTLPSKSGGASTAIPTRLIFDAEDGDGYVEIIWEPTDDFITRHSHLLERYNVAGEPLTLELINQIRNISDCQERTEPFLKVAEQHLRHRGRELPTRLDLVNANRIAELEAITSESSPKNQTATTRIIDMVSELRYHLAENLCILHPSISIVDCPGFGGGSAHEDRIRETITEADAVFVVARASRLTTVEMEESVALCERVREADPNSDSGEKFFILLNAIDDWDGGSTSHVESLSSALYGYDGAKPPDFNGRTWIEISAQTAVYSQVNKANGGLSPKDKKLYHGSIIKLAGSDVDLEADTLDDLAFEASGGAFLCASLLKVTSNLLKSRIERGARDLALAIKAVENAVDKAIDDQSLTKTVAGDPLMNPSSNEALLLRSKNRARAQVLGFRRQQLDEISRLRDRLVKDVVPGVVKAASGGIQTYLQATWEVFGSESNINWREAKIAPLRLDLTFLSSMEAQSVNFIVDAAPKLTTVIGEYFNEALCTYALLSSLNKCFFDEPKFKPLLQETMDDASSSLCKSLSDGTRDIVEEIWNNNKRFHFIASAEEGSTRNNTAGFGALTKKSFGFGTGTAQNRSEEPPTPSLKEIIGEIEIQPGASKAEMKVVFKPLHDALNAHFLRPIVILVCDAYLDKYETGLRDLNSQLNGAIDMIYGQIRRLDEESQERILAGTKPQSEASAAEAHRRLGKLKAGQQHLQELTGALITDRKIMED